MGNSPLKSLWSWAWPVAAFVALALGVALLFGDPVEDLRFRFRGVIAEGKAVEEQVDLGSGFTRSPSAADSSYRHRLVYEYTDGEGKTHTGRHAWDANSGHAIFRPGDMVGVRYLPAQPHRSQLVEKSIVDSGLALLFAVPLGAAVVLLAMAANRYDLVPAALGTVERWRARRRRKREGSPEEDAPFAYEWEIALRKNVGQYGRLGTLGQFRLRQLIVGFLDGKGWEGCNGLKMTDEIKVTVAGQACALLMGTIEHDHFASVRAVLVYPTAFGTPQDTAGMEHQVATLGLAQYRGPVVLAWDNVLAGGRDPDGGRNVVHHEFAHQLDFAGETLGQTFSADLAAKRRLRDEVMPAEYAALVRAAEEGRPTLLDHYGATDPREFFAVSTECFFGKPVEMHDQHPRLYEVLRGFYGQDPAEQLRLYRSLAGSAARRDREAGQGASG